MQLNATGPGEVSENHRYLSNRRFFRIESKPRNEAITSFHSRTLVALSLRQVTGISLTRYPLRAAR